MLSSIFKNKYALYSRERYSFLILPNKKYIQISYRSKTLNIQNAI